MRFGCKVRVVNRNPGGRSSASYVKSTIALGKETNTENEYFLLHFSNIVRGSLKGSRYTKYSLKFNPTQVFTKCLNEGKITISFEDPQHDLFIQGDVLQLSPFVDLLNSCLAGDAGVLQPSSLTAAARGRYNRHILEEKQALPEPREALHEENVIKENEASCSKQVISSTAN